MTDYQEITLLERERIETYPYRRGVLTVGQLKQILRDMPDDIALRRDDFREGYILVGRIELIRSDGKEELVFA